MTAARFPTGARASPFGFFTSAFGRPSCSRSPRSRNLASPLPSRRPPPPARSFFHPAVLSLAGAPSHPAVNSCRRTATLIPSPSLSLAVPSSARPAALSSFDYTNPQIIECSARRPFPPTRRPLCAARRCAATEAPNINKLRRKFRGPLLRPARRYARCRKQCSPIRLAFKDFVETSFAGGSRWSFRSNLLGDEWQVDDFKLDVRVCG